MHTDGDNISGTVAQRRCYRLLSNVSIVFRQSGRAPGYFIWNIAVYTEWICECVKSADFFRLRYQWCNCIRYPLCRSEWRYFIKAKQLAASRDASLYINKICFPFSTSINHEKSRHGDSFCHLLYLSIKNYDWPGMTGKQTFLHTLIFILFICIQNISVVIHFPNPEVELCSHLIISDVWELVCNRICSAICGSYLW